MDRNGDGFLSEQEVLEGYREVYGEDFNEKDVAQLFNKADANGDNRLSYNEFMMSAIDE